MGNLKNVFLVFVFLILSVHTNSNAAVPQIERDTLVALYNSTDGANWTDNTTNWLSGDPCDNSSISAFIGNLSYVYDLSLQGNEFTESIPANLSNITNLQTVALQAKLRSGMISFELINLTNLNYLNFAYNNITLAIKSRRKN